MHEHDVMSMQFVIKLIKRYIIAIVSSCFTDFNAVV